MNTMLASGGYPWTVVPVTLRNEYMESLEEASVSQSIKPFAKFLSDLVRDTLKGKTPPIPAAIDTVTETATGPA